MLKRTYTTPKKRPLKTFEMVMKGEGTISCLKVGWVLGNRTRDTAYSRQKS